MNVIAAIEQPEVLRKILCHLGEPTALPVPRPARGPPSEPLLGFDDDPPGFERQLEPGDDTLVIQLD